MNTQSIRSAANTAARLFPVLALCCLTLALAACAGKLGKKDEGSGAASPAGSESIGYGASVVVSPPWETKAVLKPELAKKETLDARRKAGESIPLVAASGPASSRGVEPLFIVMLVNQEGNYMPAEFAQTLKPDDFAALSRDLYEREKATAKKNKAPYTLMDLQVAGDSIDGKPAILTKLTVADAKGVPIRSLHWDIYLPDGAGLSVRTECDPDQPGIEGQITGMVKSLRVR